MQRDNKFQRLYLHNVAIEEEASAQSQVYLLTTGTDESNEDLFITTILHKALAVKYNRKNSIINPSTESDNMRRSRSKRDMVVSEDDGYGEYDKDITVDDVQSLRGIIAAHKCERISINDSSSE